MKAFFCGFRQRAHHGWISSDEPWYCWHSKTWCAGVPVAVLQVGGRHRLVLGTNAVQRVAQWPKVWPQVELKATWSTTLAGQTGAPRCFPIFCCWLQVPSLGHPLQLWLDSSMFHFGEATEACVELSLQCINVRTHIYSLFTYCFRKVLETSMVYCHATQTEVPFCKHTFSPSSVGAL